MVMHLRYPNAHTSWFRSLVLHLFLDMKDGIFDEIVARCLLERFFVHRPHVWGTLNTVIELVRNPKYGFMERDFVKLSPNVTMLLQNVSALPHAPKYIS
jgi:CCR4-NOT transcription complex subunit 1